MLKNKVHNVKKYFSTRMATGQLFLGPETRYTATIFFMTIQQTIREEMTKALRAHEALRLEVLRSILTAFTNELVAQRRTPQEALEDAGALTVLKRLVKQRKDSAEQFEKGGRHELAEKEKKELLILEEFLPKAMSRDDIRAIAVAKKAELNIADKSGMGKFIGAVLKECKGAADGNDVKAVVEELLT